MEKNQDFVILKHALKYNVTVSMLLNASYKTAGVIIWVSNFLSSTCPCLYSYASLLNHAGGIIQYFSFLLTEGKHGSAKTWSWNFKGLNMDIKKLQNWRTAEEDHTHTHTLNCSLFIMGFYLFLFFNYKKINLIALSCPVSPT